MSNEIINIENRPFLFDKVGRVVIEEDKVLRIISGEQYINLYKELLNSEKINDLFSKGLVETKIHSEDNDVLILEHKKIDFILHPSEYTNKMFWDAATMYINLCKELYASFGVLTIDSHPWNITFDGANPVFFDFSSLYKGSEISQEWIDEFDKYFATPIRLASFSKKTYSLALEYRRQHLSGFGLELLNKKFVKGLLNKKFASVSKNNNSPTEVFDRILVWLQNNKPIEPNTEYWFVYEQSHLAEIDNPKTIKQQFVHEILSKRKPKTVLDLASNKGFYAFMANKLGASVMAFDYEEQTINQCREEVKNTGLKVTSALMNFNMPTPPSGMGLMNKGAFERYGSHIVLALGLIHHICLVQRIPVYIFCEICKKYASEGIILEFVDPNDVHVKSWNAEIPVDYTIEKIHNYMSDKFSKLEKSESINHEGVNRTIIYFYN
jgi:SAM-dependent methyltransferase